MAGNYSKLALDQTLVVMTSSPAGLGHIRVMEALRDGLSRETRVAEMGLRDPGMRVLHRVSSINPTLRSLMEFVQSNRWVEPIFTTYYRRALKTRPDKARHVLIDAILRVKPLPSRVVVVCTHFGLAHQLAVVKDEVGQKLGVTLELVVVVTDDSPQMIWGVLGANLILVPSESTKNALISYMYRQAINVPRVEVTPYPVSVRMGKRLNVNEMKQRSNMFHKSTNGELHIVIPVSGAAVQLSYFQRMIEVLGVSENARVSVVSRVSKQTHEFLDWCQRLERVSVRAFEIDREVVEAYEELYMNDVIGLEVTKPSEQAFKALFTPKQRGGSLLMFSDPVGRQEDDNVRFLRRHRLLPSLEVQEQLNELFATGKKLLVTKEMLLEARRWRGLMLPLEGVIAGVAIQLLRETGIFSAMNDFAGFVKGHTELTSEGVRRMWELVGV